MHLERWFERFFENVKQVPEVIVTKNIQLLPICEGLYHGIPNPHTWMSASNALIYIDNIFNAFKKHDPEHAAVYQRNAENYAL